MARRSRGSGALNVCFQTANLTFTKSQRLVSAPSHWSFGIFGEKLQPMGRAERNHQVADREALLEPSLRNVPAATRTCHQAAPGRFEERRPTLASVNAAEQSGRRARGPRTGRVRPAPARTTLAIDGWVDTQGTSFPGEGH